MIYFNWYELLTNTNKDNNSILILTHALTIGYNKKIARNDMNLREQLLIPYYSSVILQRGYIVKTPKGIFSKYKCKDPQSYINDPFFLYTLQPVAEKINYLYILSKRNPQDNSTFIPKDYVEPKFWNNNFVKETKTTLQLIFDTK